MKVWLSCVRIIFIRDHFVVLEDFGNCLLKCKVFFIRVLGYARSSALKTELEYFSELSDKVIILFCEWFAQSVSPLFVFNCFADMRNGFLYWCTFIVWYCIMMLLHNNGWTFWTVHNWLKKVNMKLETVARVERFVFA